MDIEFANCAKKWTRAPLIMVKGQGKPGSIFGCGNLNSSWQHIVLVPRLRPAPDPPGDRDKLSACGSRSDVLPILCRSFPVQLMAAVGQTTFIRVGSPRAITQPTFRLSGQVASAWPTSRTEPPTR